MSDHGDHHDKHHDKHGHHIHEKKDHVRHHHHVHKDDTSHEKKLHKTEKEKEQWEDQSGRNMLSSYSKASGTQGVTKTSGSRKVTTAAQSSNDLSIGEEFRKKLKGIKGRISFSRSRARQRGRAVFSK